MKKYRIYVHNKNGICYEFTSGSRNAIKAASEELYQSEGNYVEVSTIRGKTLSRAGYADGEKGLTLVRQYA